MKFSNKEIEKIANLARLGLDKKDVKKFSKEMSSILDYVEKLKEVNTDNVEPTSQVTGLKDVLREDKVGQEKNQSDILDNAPANKDDYIKVKNVFAP